MKYLWESKKKKIAPADSYCYTSIMKKKDLAIGIDILDENEIKILTVIEKSTNRRKHYGN